MKTSEKMEKLLRGGREFIEASFLQMKLTKITADEVLDFYLVMTMAPSADGFIAHCEHDRAVGRASDFTPVSKYCPSSSPCKEHKHTSLLFCCASCKRDFIADYTFRHANFQGKILPFCPDCGSSKFVTEVKGDDCAS